MILSMAILNFKYRKKKNLNKYIFSFGDPYELKPQFSLRQIVCQKDIVCVCRQINNKNTKNFNEKLYVFRIGNMT